jgi:2-hydroxy-3-oxopropionate reductase
VDTEAAVSVLSGGLAGSRILERKAASMLAGNFEPGFRIDLHHKDMGIVTAAARERDVVIPLGALTAQLVAAPARRVTAVWTIRPCCVASIDSLDVRLDA